MFSRRKKSDDGADDAVAPIAAAPDDTSGERPDDPPAVTETDAAAPAVSISMTSFQGLGTSGPVVSAPASAAGAAASTPTGVVSSPADATSAASPGAGETSAAVTPAPLPIPAAEAPEPRETIPGLRDNGLLREALEAVGEPPTSVQIMNVTRQLMQGHVFLRVKGDARALLAEGKELPLATVKSGDKTFLLAFSSGEAFQASARAAQDTQTSAMGQPFVNVIRHMLKGAYAGLILDQSSAPSRAVIPRELLERALAEGDEDFSIKGLLSVARTPETAGIVASALVGPPLWVAVGQAPPETPGGKARVGVAESRTPTGERYLEVFSHPLEVVALGRGNQPMPYTAVQLATSLRDHPELTGVVVDPGGPWIRLSRDDLAPVLALADAL